MGLASSSHDSSAREREQARYMKVLPHVGPKRSWFGFRDAGASQQRIESGDQRQGYGTSRRAGGGVGESDSQQPAALGLGRLCWLRGIEMELYFRATVLVVETDVAICKLEN